MTISDFSTIGLDLLKLLRSSRWERKKIRDYQAKSLVQIMRYAVTNVPFYRATGIAVSDIQSARDLERFPIISKATIREHQTALIADHFDPETLSFSVTSGSSGEPTKTYFDRSTWLHDKYALKIRRMVENRIGLFSRVLIASEYAPDQLRSGPSRYLPGDGLLFKQRRVSVHQSPESHVGVFREFKPHALYAFPSYVSELMDYCESQSIQLPRLKTVFTSSEVLSDQLRKRIADFFDAKVCDVYGSTEFKEVASECAQGRLHLNFESTYVESIADDSSENNSLVLTTLRNRAMPLLRYRIGDFGDTKDEPCACGRQSSWIDSVAGREVDVLVLPSGRRVSPYVLITHGIDNTREILRYQFVQLSLDRLEIQVVLAADGRGINELQYLAQELAVRLDGEMDVTMVDVGLISRSRGGKHRVLIRAAESSV